MATNFSAASYRDSLTALLRANGITLDVTGFEADRDVHKFERGSGAVVELAIESLDFEAAPGPGLLPATLVGALLCMVRLNHGDSEERALDLALDVAAALYTHDVEAPAFGSLGGGPISVRSVEPAPVDGVLGRRVASYAITYAHELVIRKTDREDPDPAPIGAAYAGRSPSVGPDHAGDYRKVV